MALAEVVQNGGAQTILCFTVVHHGVQPFQILTAQSDPLLRGQLLVVIAVVDEEFGCVDIAAGEEQDAVRPFAVPACPACFLIIGLQAFRHIVVDHEADIGLVDAHAEGVGGHHDLHPVKLEVILTLGPFLVAEPCVVAGGVVAVKRQVAAHPLHPGTGGAVDNAAFAPPLSQQRPEGGGFFCGGHGLHLKVEVGSVEAGDDGAGRLKTQLGGDVPAHRLSGGGGEGADHGTARELCQKVRDLAVAGPEILPPLGDAVGFVHRQQGEIQALGSGDKAVRLQPLRGDIDELVGPRTQALIDGAELCRGQGGVDIGRRDARVFQSHDLILHQRDERGHHQRHSGQHQCGHLIAHGLAAAGGHDAQRVPPGEQTVDEPFLPIPEGFVAEILL